MKTDIKSVPFEQLSEQVKALGVPAFRAKQIRTWLQNGVVSFDEMTNLPQTLREQLKEQFVIPHVKIERKLVSQIDGTVKYLFSLPDGETVESVLMHYHHGWSQCLSTQVGCRMGCTFCATGQGGLVRNMLPSEILSQIEVAQADHGVRVSSVVLMGMGEPLDNYDHVMRFLEMLSEEGGVQIGMRHVSLSTCGIVNRMEDLMNEKLQLTLSVSLHAPNDALRQQLMPVAKRWSVDELLDVCRRYAEHTGRRISFEYAMVDGVTDTDDCARELAQKLRGMLCRVNLIPVNPVDGTAYRRSHAKRLEAFVRILEKAGITATVRRTLGADIEASCGQLRRKEQKNLHTGS